VERLGSLEEVFEVLGQTQDVLCVLPGLLNVEGDHVKLVEVLQPGQVVFALDQAKFAKFGQAAERKVVSMQVEEFTMTFFTREDFVCLVENVFHPMGKERLTLKVFNLSYRVN